MPPFLLFPSLGSGHSVEAGGDSRTGKTLAGRLGAGRASWEGREGQEKTSPAQHLPWPVLKTILLPQILIRRMVRVGTFLIAPHIPSRRYPFHFPQLLPATTCCFWFATPIPPAVPCCRVLHTHRPPYLPPAACLPQPCHAAADLVWCRCTTARSLHPFAF